MKVKKMKGIIIIVFLLSLVLLSGCNNTPIGMFEVDAGLLDNNLSKCKVLCRTSIDIGATVVEDGRIEDERCVCYDRCIPEYNSCNTCT